MLWLDIGGGVGALLVGGALMALLDPALARKWLARLTGHGPRKP